MSSAIESVELFEKPQAETIYMIAGWRQWADGGETSSGLAQYLIDTLGAKKIGHIKPDGFYLYQTPLSQALFRPQVKFEEGYRTQLVGPRNEVFYWSNGDKGLVIFLGDEPHMNVERYAEAFFEVVQQLGVKRVAATGGVYAMVPFDKERSFSCSFSLPGMKAELSEYAISFSNYEGGVSIGSYLNDRAELLGIEYFAMYAFVPAYDLSQIGPRGQSVTIEEDYKAWHDALLRLNHMFKLGLDLGDLSQRSKELMTSINNHIDELSKQLPNVPVKEYIAKLTADFEERHFDKLDDVWQDALGDIFKDLD
jgi:proteasome assembly chaperone (PAC2) family protein